MALDPRKIATLKQKLLLATDFTEIVEYFMELGNDFAFIESGEPWSNPRFVAALGKAMSAATGGEGGVLETSPRRVAEHRLVHGVVEMGKWVGMMFYFEDVEQGFLALGDESGPSRYIRFSLIESPNGKPVTVH
jgi:hypothetical protein